MFLPPLSEPFLDFGDFWRHIPVLDQPQFGPYLHDSALVTLTDADLGTAFQSEWAARLDRLKLYELGRSVPTPASTQRESAKERLVINRGAVILRYREPPFAGSMQPTLTVTTRE